MLRSTRFNSFDFLRLFAAILVVYSHSYPLLGLSGRELINRIFPITNGGALGVYMFFSLSGYLNAKSLQRNSIAIFLINRSLRIFPALLIVLILTALILGPLATTMPLNTYFHQTSVFSYIYENALLSPNYSLPGVFGDNLYKNAVNGSLWTLPTEFSLYLMLPLILKNSQNPFRSSIFFAGGFLFLHALSLSVGMRTIETFGLGPIDNVSANASVFFIGAAISYSNVKFRSWRQALVILALLLFTSHTQYAAIAFLVLIPFVAVSFGSIDIPVLRLKNDISYGLYIYAFPVQQMIYHLLKNDLPPYALFATSLAVSAVLATASWFLIERPILRNRQRIMSIFLGSTELVAADARAA